MLSFPPFRLDLDDERIWKSGEELHLRRKPFAILRYLVRHPQRLVTHDELVEAVWGKIAMSESLIRSHVRALRQVVGEGVVETVIGRGYRFVPQVKYEEVDGSGGGAENAATQDPGRMIVGRDQELEALRAALRSVKDRRRTTVFVTGEAGTGKTMLVDGFLEQTGAPGPLVVGRGTCIEQYGSGQAYLPVLDAIGSLCRGRGADQAIEVFEKKAPTWLAQLPGVVPPERLDDLQRRAAGATQARTLREVAEAIESLSAEAPVTIVFEDLHWTDPSTAELLAFLAGRRDPARLLILGTYRPEEVSRGHPLTRVTGELIAHRQASSIALEGLGTQAVDVYLSKRLPGHALPPEVAGTLHRSTGGNPLFLSTFVDDLESRGLIRERDGRWELSTSVDDIAARRPESIRGLIDARIDRLSEVERRIIEVAGIAGLSFTAGVVAHALEADPDGVDSACESLAGERRLLQYLGTEIWPDGTIQSRYAFRHALFQHAALARSTAATVRGLHRKIAERLETGHAGNEGQVAAELAMHYGQGQAPVKAARYHVLAGERAALRYGHAEAVAHHELAREFLASVPEGREREALDLRASLSHGWSLFQVEGRPDAALSSLERARDIARRLDDKASLGQELIRLEGMLLVRGDLREASDAARSLAPILHHVSDDALRNFSKQIEAARVLFQGRFEEAHRLFDDLGVFRVQEKSARDAARAYLLGFSMGAFYSWLTGAPDRALAIVRRAQQIALEAEDPLEHAAMLGEGALLHAWRREPAQAAEVARQSLAPSERQSFGIWQNRAELILRWAEAELSPAVSPERASELLSKPWEVGSVGRTMHAVLYATMAVRLGQAERALEVIASTLATIERTDEHWLEPELHRLRGEAQRSSDHPAKEAERSIATAIKIASEQGSRSLELRAQLSMYSLATGAKKKRAREEIARLLSVFTEGYDTPDLVDARAVVGT